mgnify:CR=1 FL=1
MGNNKDNAPTIQETLRLIEAKLANNKTKKKGISNKDTKNIASNNISLSNIFKKREENKKQIIKSEKNDNVLLLTKKVDEKGKIVDLERKKTFKKELKIKTKDKIEKEQDKKINLKIIDNRNLSKTTDLAVIIKKLKNIRDNKINSNKTRSSKKINNEIKKLNETINLAEDLFTKELLDL